MKADLTFYLDGLVEELVQILTSQESPLQLNQKVGESYFFSSRNSILDGDFFYSKISIDKHEQPRHIPIQTALQVQPQIYLMYSGCNVNKEKMSEFRKIMEYFVSQKIAFYLLATDETGETILVKGCNPRTGAEVDNPNFEQRVLDLLE